MCSVRHFALLTVQHHCVCLYETSPIDASFSSSTPRNSELIQINMLVLEVESSGVSQLVIMNNEAVDESIINPVDSRTFRLHVTLLEDFFLTVPPLEQIHLQGIATVRDTSSDIYASPLTAIFALELDLFQNVSIGQSS
jgi:hypothetical protein